VGKDLSYKKKFDEIIGLPFEFEEVGFPDYVITTGPSRFISLIDMSMFEKGKVLEWKPFVVKGLPKEGHVYFEEICFNVEFINKSIEILNPKEYAIQKDRLREEKRDVYILVLKNGNYGIQIAPALPKEVEENKKEFEKYIKEPPKSVFVL